MTQQELADPQSKQSLSNSRRNEEMRVFSHSLPLVRLATRALQLLALLSLLTAAAANGASSILPISPVWQQTPEWCWLASSQMIFQYYNIPGIPNPGNSYQCGILLVAHIPCVAIGAGSLGAPDTVIAQVLQQYPALAQGAFPSTPVQKLHSTILLRPLQPGEVQQSINLGHPFIAGISPTMPPNPYGPEHAVVIVGYDFGTDASGNPYQNVVVNDPFPYSTPLPIGPGGTLVSVPDPYLAVGAAMLQQGQYEIDVTRFATRLQWVATILGHP